MAKRASKFDSEAVRGKNLKPTRSKDNADMVIKGEKDNSEVGVSDRVAVNAQYMPTSTSPTQQQMAQTLLSIAANSRVTPQYQSQPQTNTVICTLRDQQLQTQPQSMVRPNVAFTTKSSDNQGMSSTFSGGSVHQSHYHQTGASIAASFVNDAQTDGLEMVKQVLDANSDYFTDAANASAHEAAQAVAMLTDEFAGNEHGNATHFSFQQLPGERRAQCMPSQVSRVSVNNGKFVFVESGKLVATDSTQRQTERTLSLQQCSFSGQEDYNFMDKNAVDTAADEVVVATTESCRSASDESLLQLSAGLNSSVRRSRFLRSDSFVCFTCGMTFPSDKYLSMHTPTHNVQQHSMDDFAGERNLQEHVERVVTTTMSSMSQENRTIGAGGGTHGAMTWSCKICNKIFAQNSNFKNHLRTHSDERPYVCEVCNIGFKERYHLKKHHLFKHSNELKEKCRVCGKLFKDSTAVRAHERIHSEDRPYSCRRCGKSFKTSECLWHHENRSKTCGLSAVTLSMMENAAAASSTPPKIQKINAKANVTEDKNPTGIVYQNQQQGNAINLTQKVLISNCHTPQQQQRSVMTTENILHSLAPNELFINGFAPGQRSVAFFFPTSAIGQSGYVQTPRVAIIRPMQPTQQQASVQTSVAASVSLAEKNGAIPVAPVAASQALNCNLISVSCQNSFKRSNATVQRKVPQVKPEPIEIVDNELNEIDSGKAIDNMLVAEVEVKTSSPETTKAILKKFACVKCGKRFSSPSAFEKHLLTHSENRPYKCEACDIGFKLKVHLKKHNLYRHSDDKPCACTVCGKKFKDSSAVRLHERIHSNQRPFMCECGKTFKTKENLWGHRHRGPCEKLVPNSSFSDEMSTNSSSTDMRATSPNDRKSTGPQVSESAVQQTVHLGITNCLTGTEVKPENNTADFASYSEEKNNNGNVPFVQIPPELNYFNCSAISLMPKQILTSPTIRIVRRDSALSVANAPYAPYTIDNTPMKEAIYPKTEQALTTNPPSIRIVDVGNAPNVSPVQKESALPPFETFAPNIRTVSFASFPTSSSTVSDQGCPTVIAERPASLSEKCPTIQHLLRRNITAPGVAMKGNKLPGIYGIFNGGQQGNWDASAAPVPVILSSLYSPSKSYVVANSPLGYNAHRTFTLSALSSPSSPGSSQHALLTSDNPMMPVGASEISPHTPPPSVGSTRGTPRQNAEHPASPYSDFSPAHTPKTTQAMTHIYAMNAPDFVTQSSQSHAILASSSGDGGTADETGALPIYYWDDESSDKKHAPFVVWHTTAEGIFHEISKNGFNQL